LWPTGLLFAATLAILFSTIVWMKAGINDAAAERQHGRVLAALQQHLAGAGDALAALAGAEGLVGAAPDAARRRLNGFMTKAEAAFDAAALLTEDGEVIGGMSRGQKLTSADIREFRSILTRLVHGPDDAPADGTRAASAGTDGAPALRSELASQNGDLYAVLALPIVSTAQGSADASHMLLIAERRMTPEAIQAVANRSGAADLRVVPGLAKDGPGSIPVQAIGKGARVSLVYTPDVPALLTRERLVPLALTGFLLTSVLFGFVLLYLHWVTKDLEQSQAQSQELLGRDPLSGLANRMLFGQRLDAALAALPQTGDGLAVLFIDLDRFKDVNDTYGHQAGDDLIQMVAQRLVNVIRVTDTLARFGGDEFAIIQTGIQSTADAETLARRILDALTRPFGISHTQVTVGASIGVALAPENGNGRESLMRLADTALYQAKSEGRNRFSFFQRRMDETIRMRKVVEDDLRRAINEDELVLEYQPLFSSDGENIVGLEALVRWPHPTRGLISPSDFIAIAEERGLIIPLGEWVLRRACEDCKRWPGIRIAVNVSPIQFRHRDYVQTVMRVLEETGFDPSRLELELTEGVVVEDADAAEAAMMDLRALGVHLALDDFGTGYSSLIYLRRFAFDKIKIDRSFLESMEATGESAILVHSIVHLGRALGLTVTAEGVETKEQHRFLQALGCHQLQGFLFSKPVPRHEIDRMLGIVEHIPELTTSAAA
jgi:diguanylate cyclase (GGDEF)-like protein